MAHIYNSRVHRDWLEFKVSLGYVSTTTKAQNVFSLAKVRAMPRAQNKDGMAAIPTQESHSLDNGIDICTDSYH